MTVYMRAYREARRMGLIPAPSPPPPHVPEWEDDDFIDERPGHCPLCSEPTKGDLCGYCLREELAS